MTPIWHVAALASLFCVKLVLVWVSVVLVRRVSASRAAHDALARRVDELSLRLRAFESQESKRIPIDPLNSIQGTSRQAGKRRIDLPLRSRAMGPTLIAVPSLATLGSETSASEAAEELARRYGAIWALSDSGATASAIAETTGHPIGQVELILGLRRSSESASASEVQGASTDAR